MGIIEAASDLFDKGIGLAGTMAKQAGDFANTAGLKAQILDKNLEYDRLMKELGASVYETVKEYPEIVESNQGLFTRIAGVVEARQMLEDKLAEVEAAADASRPIDVDPIAPDDASVEDVFATGAEQVKEAVQAEEAARNAGAASGYRSATVAGTQEGNE